MQRAKKNRANLDTGKLTQEFTSGQLVIGTCAALFVMVFCFLAGMLIERMLSGDQVVFNETSNPPAISQEESAAAATQRDRGTSRSSSLPRNASDAPPLSAVDSTPKETVVAAVDPAKPSRGTGPRVTKLPPLPPAEEKAPENPALQLTRNTPTSPAKKNAANKVPPTPNTDAQAASNSVAAKPEKPGIEQKESPVKPPPTLPSTQVAKKETSEREIPAKPQAQSTPPPKTIPKATQEAKPTKKIERGKYGIQVASLQGSSRQADAAEYLSRLAKGGYNAKVIPSADERYYRVAIVGYNDRASAVVGCKALREKAAFYDAWVVELP